MGANPLRQPSYGMWYIRKRHPSQFREGCLFVWGYLGGAVPLKTIPQGFDSPYLHTHIITRLFLISKPICLDHTSLLERLVCLKRFFWLSLDQSN